MGSGFISVFPSSTQSFGSANTARQHKQATLLFVGEVKEANSKIWLLYFLGDYLSLKPWR